ncbi:MAG: hypothetical protein R3A13_02810 [Bdellovibrionota bacterium]
MSTTLLEYFSDQALMKVVKALIVSNKPRYLRELVSLCSLSPGERF